MSALLRHDHGSSFVPDEPKKGPGVRLGQANRFTEGRTKERKNVPHGITIFEIYIPDGTIRVQSNTT